MRRLMLLSVILISILGAATIQAVPVVYTLEPTPNDMYDLAHYEAYTWGFDLLPTSEYEIVEAKLTFHNIFNWNDDPNWLHINLLDNPALGTQMHYDGQAANDNYFAGQGTYLTTWSDNIAGGPGQDVTFTFSDEGWLQYLNDYALDGRVGFGFDPDCHFFNDGITLEVAQIVPEPATMLLLGFGLVGAGIARRKKSQ